MRHSIRRVKIVRTGAALAVALALTLPAGAQTTRRVADQAEPATPATPSASTIGGQVVDRRNALAIAGAVITLLRANTPVASVSTETATLLDNRPVGPLDLLAPAYLTLGGTNVFNSAVQNYGYIGSGVAPALNKFATPGANGLQDFLNGTYSAEEFGLTPPQLTLTLSLRI
jgi:hypothetical protein